MKRKRTPKKSPPNRLVFLSGLYRPFPHILRTAIFDIVLPENLFLEFQRFFSVDDHLLVDFTKGKTTSDTLFRPVPETNQPGKLRKPSEPELTGSLQDSPHISTGPAKRRQDDYGGTNRAD